VDKVINELKDYAAVHFATEEAIWRKHFQGDPWELWHQRAHTDFVDQVIKLNEEQSHKPLDEVIESIVTFLTHWLALHIIESDKRMAKVVLSLPSGCSLEHAKRMADQEMSGATQMLIETVMTMYDKLANHTVRMTREIFKRKQMEQALLQTQEELRITMDKAVEANLSKADFLARISHDLRTPLQGLLGYAEVLTGDKVTDSERIEYARIILGSSKTLVTLVDEILVHAKVEAGKVVLAFSNCKPEYLLDEVSLLFAKAAQSKGLSLNHSWDGLHGQPYLFDSQRVRQMLSNFVSNAIKFTKSGSISVKAEETERIGDEVVLLFSVSDTGSGVSLEKQKLLFQRFEQIHNSNLQEGGSGLGLYIVSELAELMGGEVGVESQLNQGARFWFSIRASLVSHG
jgi:hemerythrin-like metal-binding protein